MRWILLTAAVAGCAPDPTTACEAFVEAYTACISQAWADDPASLELLLAPFDERYCEGADALEGEEARRAKDTWTCLADHYTSADCTTHNLGDPEAFGCAPPSETDGTSSSGALRL